MLIESPVEPFSVLWSFVFRIYLYIINIVFSYQILKTAAKKARARVALLKKEKVELEQKRDAALANPRAFYEDLLHKVHCHSIYYDIYMFVVYFGRF